MQKIALLLSFTIVYTAASVASEAVLNTTGPFECPVRSCESKLLTSVGAFTKHLKSTHMDNVPQDSPLLCCFCVASKISNNELKRNASGKIAWKDVTEKIELYTNPYLLAVHKADIHKQKYKSRNIFKEQKTHKINVSIPQHEETPFYVHSMDMDTSYLDEIINS